VKVKSVLGVGILKSEPNNEKITLVEGNTEKVVSIKELFTKKQRSTIFSINARQGFALTSGKVSLRKFLIISYNPISSMIRMQQVLQRKEPAKVFRLCSEKSSRMN